MQGEGAPDAAGAEQAPATTDDAPDVGELPIEECADVDRAAPAPTVVDMTQIPDAEAAPTVPADPVADRWAERDALALRRPYRNMRVTGIGDTGPVTSQVPQSPAETPAAPAGIVWRIRVIGTVHLFERPGNKHGKRKPYNEIVVPEHGIQWDVNGGVLITETSDPVPQPGPFWLPYSKLDTAYQE
jgi:hypothetical protein